MLIYAFLQPFSSPVTLPSAYVHTGVNAALTEYVMRYEINPIVKLLATGFSQARQSIS